MSSYDPFDDTRRQMREVQKWARQHKKALVLGVGGLLLAVGLWQSYYQVEAEEVGVVLRFGKHVETTAPGPHFRIPIVDQVTIVPVARQLRKEFGFRTLRADVQSEFIRNANTMAEARMLTADLNIGTVEWIVQYIIDDPVAFIFNFRDVDQTLRLMAEGAMRSVVGDYTVDELITEGRVAIERAAQERLKELNALYATGVIIQHVKLKRVDVPEPVKPALSEVEESKQEKARLINQADEEYNKRIPRAKGEAQQVIAAARGYAAERTNRAEGDAFRFRELHQEYRKAKTVTRTRLYFEALSSSLPKAERKVLVDPDVKGLLPLLELKGGKQ